MKREVQVSILGVVSVVCGTAQNIGANLKLLVQDAQQMPVQHAAIAIRNQAAGYRQNVQSNAAGEVQAVSLAAGVYTVEVEAAGFAKVTFEEVRLTVGESRTLRALLQPQSTHQEITVSAEAVSVTGATESSTGSSYNQKLMGELPMLSSGQGRNFKTQVYLTPGVAPSTQAHRPFAVAGARNRNNNYLVDSNDYNEIEGGLMMGRGVSEQLIPSESIEGMQVLTHNFKAEYGRQSGSVISIVTKRGTNDLHGSLYEFLRNDKLNARNTFDRTTPPLKNNHFGVQAGGPILHNKLFAFGNYEGAKSRSASARTIQTLTAEQKAQAAPAVQALAALYADPNIPGSNLFRASLGQGSDLKTFLLRADYNVTDRHRLFARSTYLKTESDIAAGAALHQGLRDIGSQAHSLHHIWTPSPRFLNEARWNYTRFRIVDGFEDPLRLGDAARNGDVGFVTVNGLTFLGHFNWYGQRNFQNNFQWTDDLTMTLGQHSLKTGVAVRRLQLNNGTLSNGYIGQLRFNSIPDFLAARPASYNRNIGDPYIGLRATEFNVYAQDDWRIARGLTLNLGLRYELNTVPYEVNSRIREQYRYRPDRNNFAPRFGFAWQPGTDGKLVVRGGYGIFYNVLELSFVGLTRFNPPLISNLSAASPMFPNLLANAQAGIPSGLVVPDASLRQPYAQHFSLKVERELFVPTITASLGYLGTAGVKLPRNSRPNGGDGLAQALRPDPSVGVVNRLETAATSRYDGLEASLAWQRGGTSIRASYTYSKFLDTVSDFPTTNQQIERFLLPLDEDNWALNRGVSDFDIRHLCSLGYSYELPFLRSNRWLGGWQLQGISTLQSGKPYTLFSGTDNLSGSNSNRILDVPGSLVRQGGGSRSAIVFAPQFTRDRISPPRGTLGTIGRNTERGDSLLQHNVAISKNFTVTERLRLQFRAESFNAANTTNYDLPDGLLTSPAFGQAVSAFDARQFQLALKLTF